MEVPFQGGQGPEESVVPYMDGCDSKSLLLHKIIVVFAIIISSSILTVFSESWCYKWFPSFFLVFGFHLQFLTLFARSLVTHSNHCCSCWHACL
jgi:hypothetical protein